MKGQIIKFDVWYSRPEFFMNGCLGYNWLLREGTLPDIKHLHWSHVFIKQVDAVTKEDAYHKMQGEIWSPNGEARPLIHAKGLQHTSMSVGDILVDTWSGCVWFVDSFGFKGLGITKGRPPGLKLVVNEYRR
jgi:hypothetical protein